MAGYKEQTTLVHNAKHTTQQATSCSVWIQKLSRKCYYTVLLPIKLPTERLASNLGHLFLVLPGNCWFISKASMEVIVIAIHSTLLLPKYSCNTPFGIFNFTLNLSKWSDQFPLLIKSSLLGFDSVKESNLDRWILWEWRSVCFMMSINHPTCPEKIRCSKQVSDMGVLCVRSGKKWCAGIGPAGNESMSFNRGAESWNAYGCNNEESRTWWVSTVKEYFDDAMIWEWVEAGWRQVFCPSLVVLIQSLPCFILCQYQSIKAVTRSSPYLGIAPDR